MLKVLIIDDESIIRKGLKTIIQWDDYGFNICGEAANGEDGLIKACELKPDLIIVDMKMPRMNGLDMIRHLRNSGINCKVIILSGYSDFIYAQKALEYGVECYLLKPIDRGKLIERVKAIYDSIIKEKKEEELLNKSIEISRDKILECMVNGEIDDYLIEKSNAWYGFDFPWDYYQIILLEPDNKSVIEENLRDVVQLEIEKYLMDNKLGILFFIGMEMAIISRNRLMESNTRHFEEINRIFKKISNFDITYVIGSSVKNRKDIFISYENAHTLLSRKFIYSPDRIISEKMGPKISCTDRLDSILQEKAEKIVDKLYMAIEINSTTNMNDLMEDVKCSFAKSGNSEETIKIGYIYIYIAIMNKLLTNNECLKGLINIDENVLYEIFNKKNLQQLHGYIKYKMVLISDELSKVKPVNIMDKILDYINKNCGEDIKLDALAQIFNYNSIYLGKIFKNHTGKYFNTYLDMVRMEKAKQLLKDGLRVCHVAEKVGYEDIRYFYLKFKKYTGIPPAAFKANSEVKKDSL